MHIHVAQKLAQTASFLPHIYTYYFFLSFTTTESTIISTQTDVTKCLTLLRICTQSNHKTKRYSIFNRLYI